MKCSRVDGVAGRDSDLVQVPDDLPAANRRATVVYPTQKSVRFQTNRFGGQSQPTIIPATYVSDRQAARPTPAIAASQRS
jgi:hypothetical protein